MIRQVSPNVCSHSIVSLLALGSLLGAGGCGGGDHDSTSDATQLDARAFDSSPGDDATAAQVDAAPGTIDAAPVDAAPPSWAIAASRLREKLLPPGDVYETDVRQISGTFLETAVASLGSNGYVTTAATSNTAGYSLFSFGI